MNEVRTMVLRRGLHALLDRALRATIDAGDYDHLLDKASVGDRIEFRIVLYSNDFPLVDGYVRR